MLIITDHNGNFFLFFDRMAGDVKYVRRDEMMQFGNKGAGKRI